MLRSRRNYKLEKVIALKSANLKHSRTATNSRKTKTFLMPVEFEAKEEPFWKSQKRTEKISSTTHGRRELGGIFSAFVSALTLLALLSYDVNEDPRLTSAPPVTTNWLGQIGLHFSSFCFILFGNASFFLPFFLFAGAVFSLANHKFSHRFFLIQILLLTTVGSALLNWWTGLKPEQALKKTTIETGGIVGDVIVTAIIPYLGVPGTGLILTTLFICLAILISQYNPVTILKRSPEWISELIYRWQIKSADRVKQLELERKRIEKKSRRLEQEIRRAGLICHMDLPAERPEPKIIDTALPNKAAQETATKSDLLELHEKGSPKLQPPSSGASSEKTSAKNDKRLKNHEPEMEDSLKNYRAPSITLLRKPENSNKPISTPEELTANQQLLIDTLAEFGIISTRGDITRGATITRYEIYPAKGVRVDRISSLNRDIARAMKAESVNILAPVPGKDSVAIDLPNTHKTPVCLRDLIDSQYFKKSEARIPLALGKDVYGETLVADLAAMPHLLIAGTTGSGKSVCINCIILSLLYKFNPEELRLILIDPKVVEMQCYNDLPHLVVPVVTDSKKVLLALRWVINEMERRYEYMARLGVRNICSYNTKQQNEKKHQNLSETIRGSNFDEENSSLPTGNQRKCDESVPLKFQSSLEKDNNPESRLPDKLPYIIVIIDELADLMQTAPKDVETAIARIAQKARAAGIHLVLATQTPRAQVITGVIKTNIPCRIAFQVPSSLDSRVILDDSGAENLLGKGDMLYLPPGSSKLIRAQGAFVSDEEVQAVVNSINSYCGPRYENEARAKIMTSSPSDASDDSVEDEELIERCIELVIMEKKASTSLLQRKLRLGYTRAARIMDILENRGIVGPENGAKAREVLVQI